MEASDFLFRPPLPAERRSSSLILKIALQIFFQAFAATFVFVVVFPASGSPSSSRFLSMPLRHYDDNLGQW